MSSEQETHEARVTALLQSTRSRRLQYLCRAYLQFGSDVMQASDLDEINKVLSRKDGK